MTQSRVRIGAWASYSAAAWALVFGVFHLTWATGRYPLLDAAQARVAFTIPWKWAYLVGVTVICFLAVPVALAPVMSWGRRLPRRLIYRLGVTGSALLVLRSVASLIQTGYLLAAGRFSLSDMGIWEPWFYLGATLFTVSTWRSRPSRGDGGTAPYQLEAGDRG